MSNFYQDNKKQLLENFQKEVMDHLKNEPLAKDPAARKLMFIEFVKDEHRLYSECYNGLEDDVVHAQEMEIEQTLTDTNNGSIGDYTPNVNIGTNEVRFTDDEERVSAAVREARRRGILNPEDTVLYRPVHMTGKMDVDSQTGHRSVKKSNMQTHDTLNEAQDITKANNDRSYIGAYSQGANEPIMLLQGALTEKRHYVEVANGAYKPVDLKGIDTVLNALAHEKHHMNNPNGLEQDANRAGLRAIGKFNR